ncbi:hypothetical protein GTP23_12065 [Pseudoduganella sp. FT93W]|uniref:Uncharacterized protein n=1 Tax=Duganella fentianensis TaxID=2692177 RepID=A0A845HY34_9BURK|nr:hypothetical protein [Duganella fentianensis]MYN45782.1 hypothetical protein [Duganella fentianensis]
MKTLSPELAAVAAAAYPLLNPAELATKAMCDQIAAATAHIKTVPRELRMERGAEAVAAVASLADMEAVRAKFWHDAPLPARMVACMAAGIKKERAGDNLNTFNCLERGRVHVALQKLCIQLTQIQRCMTGGAMPAGRAAGALDHGAGIAGLH